VDNGQDDQQQAPDSQQTGGDKDTGTGVDNDQQGTGGDKISDDQQAPVGDIEDDQQVDMPKTLPHTGAGGLTPAATFPFGNAAAAFAMLIGAGYAVLRHR
jgi:hypothetical protein